MTPKIRRAFREDAAGLSIFAAECFRDTFGAENTPGGMAAFYAKPGFARVGEHTFLLGRDVQTDWILARPL